MQPWRRVEVTGPVGRGPIIAAIDRVRDDERARVLLCRTDAGELQATDPVCPHMGQPLTDAEVVSDALVCSHHGYAFALDSGVCVQPLGGWDTSLAVHEVREVGDRVEVRLAAPQPPPAQHEGVP